MAKIDFKDIPWSSGVEIPDRLISAAFQPGPDGAAAAAKILEALNIDWKNINIPWAMLIEKWNAGSINPFNKTTSQVEDEFKDAIKDSDESKINNKVDWYRQNYDFLKDHEYYDETQNFPYIKPGWSENGRIEKSQDIIEILNYLLWRVINLDYFTTNWNNRNSFKTTCGIVFGWNDILTDVTIPGYQVKNPYDPYIEIGEEFANNIILIPTQSRNSIEAITQTDIYKKFISAYPANASDAHAMYVSNSKGEVTVATQFSSPKIGNIDIQEPVSFINGKGEMFYKYTLDLTVCGTASEYHEPEVYIKTLRQSDVDNKYSSFDPEILETSITLKQKSDQISNGTSSSEEDIILPVTIKKTPNYVKNNRITFGGNTIELDREFLTSENLTAKYKSRSSINVPYYLNLPGYTNEYRINVSAEYMDSYGIKQFYYIEYGGSTLDATILYDNGVFKSFTSDYGNITYSNGNYIYTPPQEKNNDNTITIYCVLYYADTTNSRQCTPTVISFDVTLTSQVQNRVFFLAPGESYEQWDVNRQQFIIKSATGSNCVSTDESEKGIGEAGIAYATRTLYYDEIIDKDNYTIPFSNFVTTYCGTLDDLNGDIEYIGVINQSSISTRTINLYGTDRDGRWGEVSRKVDEYNNDVTYIYKEKVSTLGDSEDGSFLYTVDSPLNYNVPQEVISTFLQDEYRNDEKVTNKNEDLDNTEFIYIEIDENAIIGKNAGETYENERLSHAYSIKASTAIYPDHNGIVTETDKPADADNDYYYLVFKVTVPSGVIGTLPYSACKGYYFLRVLRNKMQPNLSLQGISEEPIRYTMDNNNYSMRSQVHQTIYLNRLFNEDSQKILSKYTGKKYWSFYNVDGSINSAAKWDDKVVAIDNKIDNKTVYMKIFNEGDKYPGVASPYQKYNTNTNSAVTPEAEIVRVGFAGTPNTVVKKFNIDDDSMDKSSGAILYVDKLMKAIYAADKVVGYETVDSDSVVLPLALSIGNSSRYMRQNSSSMFMITVYKQRYDIEIMVMYNSPNADNDLRAYNFYTLQNPFEIKVNHNYQESGFEITPGSTLSSFTDIPKFFFASNEFIGTDDSFDTTGSALANDEDSIPIILSDNLSKFSIKNAEGYTIYPNISIASLNTNRDEWITAQKFDKFANYNDKNVVLVYVTGMNGATVNKDYRRAVYLFPMSTTQSVEKITFNIAGDSDGVYANKELNLYVHPIAGTSSISVE